MCSPQVKQTTNNIQRSYDSTAAKKTFEKMQGLNKFRINESSSIAIRPLGDTPKLKFTMDLNGHFAPHKGKPRKPAQSVEEAISRAFRD